jgi:hypothetical protein
MLRRSAPLMYFEYSGEENCFRPASGLALMAPMAAALTMAFCVLAVSSSLDRRASVPP